MFRKLFSVWIALWFCITGTYSFAETVHNDESQGYTLSTSQLYLFSSLDNKNLQWLKDGDGNIVLPAEYHIQETNLSFIVTLDEMNGKRGYIDKSSGFYMPPQFDSVYDYFCDEAAAPIFVGLNGQYWYMVRSTGAEAFPSVYYNSYNEYSEFSNGYALTTMNVSDNGYEPVNTLIDLYGNEVIYPDSIMAVSGNENGLVLLGKRDEYAPFGWYFGIGDLEGNVIINPVYDEINDFYNGYASMMKDGKWGHIDSQGNVVLAPTYEILVESDYGYFFDEAGYATFKLIDGGIITIRTDGSIFIESP